eukprot:993309-Rhodomonas_salina.3
MARKKVDDALLLAMFSVCLQAESIAAAKKQQLQRSSGQHARKRSSLTRAEVKQPAAGFEHTESSTSAWEERAEAARNYDESESQVPSSMLALCVLGVIGASLAGMSTRW